MNTELSKALDEPCCNPTQLLKYFRTPPKSHAYPVFSHSLYFQNKTTKSIATILLGALTSKVRNSRVNISFTLSKRSAWRSILSVTKAERGMLLQPQAPLSY